MAAEGEFPEEHQMARLLVHVEEIDQKGILVEAVLALRGNLEASVCRVRDSLFVNQLAIIVNAIELQLVWRAVLPVNGFLNFKIALWVYYSVLINETFGFLFLFHLRVHPQQSEVSLREVSGIVDSHLLPAEGAADLLVGPQLEHALLAKGVAALGQHFRQVLLRVKLLHAQFTVHFSL